MSQATLLIVEDEAIVAADLAAKLTQLGYEVVGITAQGPEAIALASRYRPQVVLMDIWLKGPMDGIEAAEAIRRQFDLPVIYLTAHADAATLARASSPSRSATSSNRSRNATWPPISRWPCTNIRPIGNCGSNASGCGSP